MDDNEMRYNLPSLAIGGGVASLIAQFGTYAYMLAGGKNITVALLIDGVVMIASGAVALGTRPRAQRDKRAGKNTPKP